MNKTVEQIVVGGSDIQDSFGEVFAKFLAEIEVRRSLIERIFYRTESRKTDVLDRYIYFLGIRSYQDFKEVLVLMANGLPTGALKILRSLFERAVTCIYLSKNPTEVQAFAEYDAVHKRKLLVQLPATMRQKYLPDSWAAEIEQNFQAVKSRFTKRICECGREGLMPSWTPLDTLSMALKADPQLGEIYGSAFLLPTLHLHSTAAGLLNDVEVTVDGITGTTENLHGREGVLAAAHLLIYKMVQIHNAHFELGFDSQVQEAINAYNRTWAA